MCKELAEECYMFRNGMYLCPGCMRKVNPPKMTLVTYTPGKAIYNVEVGGYETVDSIHEFETCGWFIRSVQKFKKGQVHRSVVKIYYLEYYGDARCCRCNDYSYFDMFATPCEVSACSKFKTKRKPEERNYPSKGSKYYEHLKNFHV
jgi:hypothetical protein